MFEYCESIGKKWFTKAWCWVFWGITLSAGLTSQLITFLVKLIPNELAIIGMLILFIYISSILFSFVILLINFFKYKNCFTGPWELI